MNPSKHLMKHALVIGCSGIAGHNLSRYLLLNNDILVTGIAKKDYEHKPRALDLVACDILNLDLCKNGLGERLKTITHAFFVIWISVQPPEKEVEVNKKVLENVLNLLQDAPNLKYFYLQTGTKYYGTHTSQLSKLITPFKENSPRLDAPNFYYPQEDLLREVMKKRKGVRYSISRPPIILGFTLKNEMNFGTSLAIYASMMKEMGKPLIFPGTEKAYYAIREFVDIGLLCRFILWQASHEQSNKHAFNISNGDVIRAAEFWPLVANYFQMPCEIAKESFKIEEFMKGKEDVWRGVVEKHGLRNIKLDQIQTFRFLDSCLVREADDFSSITKAEKFGFRCHNDTDVVLLNFFDSLKNMKIIPNFAGSSTA